MWKKVLEEKLFNPNRSGLLSTRNAPGIGMLCQALYLKNYWSYDHETSQDGRGQKTVEPKNFYWHRIIRRPDTRVNVKYSCSRINAPISSCFFADMKLKFSQVVVIMFDNLL